MIEASVGWLLVFDDPDGLQLHLYSWAAHGVDHSDKPGYGRPAHAPAEADHHGWADRRPGPGSPAAGAPPARPRHPRDGSRRPAYPAGLMCGTARVNGSKPAL